MNHLTDQELVREYAEHRSDRAFAELVRRYVDLVYSVALRMVRDACLAEDVSQGVFLALAQSAAQLTDRPVLAGWLHRTARNLASKAVRSDVRRRQHEQEAAAMSELLRTEPDVIWEQIAPCLDDALGHLNQTDRDALLLRYFQRRTAREIAQVLGTTEEAAQKRLSRAIERIQREFADRGIAVGAGSLALALSANAVQAAPAGLAGSICGATALFTANLATAVTTKTALTSVITMTTLQKCAVTIAFAGILSLSAYKIRQVVNQRGEIENLQRERTALSAQLADLEREHLQATNRLGMLADQLVERKGNPAELLKLRAEVTRLRGDAKQAIDPFVETALSWKSKENQLRQLFKEHPDQRIPELDLVDSQTWLNAAMNADLATDAGARSAMSGLRQRGENNFVISLHEAVRNYMQTNSGRFPSTLEQLQPFLEPSLAATLLQRYELRPAREFPTHQFGGEYYITQKAAVDPEYDVRWVVGAGGFGQVAFKAEADRAGTQ